MKNLDKHQEVELMEIVSFTPIIEKNCRSKKWFSKKNWLTLAMNLFVFLIIIFCIIKIRPNIKIGFICKDPKLSFPIPDETIKNWMLYTGNTVGPTAIIVLVEFYVECSFNANWYKHSKKWFIEYFVGILYHVVLINIVKNAYPELRPHFFETCRPDTGMTCVPGEYVAEFQCTNKNLPDIHMVDSHQSFFSGHASFAVYASVFCAWYVHRRFSSSTVNTIVQPVIIILLIMWGIICSTTRLIDHRHHWWDIIFGVIFGLLNALYVIIGRCDSFNVLKR